VLLYLGIAPNAPDLDDDAEPDGEGLDGLQHDADEGPEVAMPVLASVAPPAAGAPAPEHDRAPAAPPRAVAPAVLAGAASPAAATPAAAAVLPGAPR
jgi:hypothetical protein